MFPDLESLSREEAALISDVFSRLTLGSSSASSGRKDTELRHGSIPGAPASAMGAAPLPNDLSNSRSTGTPPTRYASDTLGSEYGLQPARPRTQLSPDCSQHTSGTVTSSGAAAAMAGSLSHLISTGTPPTRYASEVLGSDFSSQPLGRKTQKSPDPGFGSQYTSGTATSSGGAVATTDSFSNLTRTGSLPTWYSSGAQGSSVGLAPQGYRPNPSVDYSQRPSDASASSAQQHEHKIRASAKASSVQQSTEFGCEEPSGVMDSPCPSPLPALSLLQEMRRRLRQEQHGQVATRTTDDSSAPSDPGQVASSSIPIAKSAQTTGGASRRVEQSGRGATSAPGSASKAFTMLNARTNIERYGPPACINEPPQITPGKGPIRLPEPERSALLQQLYVRSVQWRQRREERFAKARQEREALEMEACTFTPQVLEASELIVQGKPPDEVYQEGKWSTPTKHHSFVLEDQHATPSDSNLSTPGSAQAPWPNNMGMNYQTRSAFTDASMDTQAGSVNNQPSVSAKSGSPSKLTVNGEEASERLYQESFLLRARREERLFQQLLEEDRQRRFTATIQCVSPRVYNPPDPPSPRHLPTGMEECTFHPRSFSSSCKRAKSAPHMRGSSGRDDRSQEDRQGKGSAAEIHGKGGQGRLHARSGLHNVSSAQTMASANTDVDWDAFIARQERFLAVREQKLRQRAQSPTAMPSMSPGSRRLLRLREMRQSSTPVDGSSYGGSAETPAEAVANVRTGVAARRDRRLNIVMEMYRDCTFQPQITRKAAAMASRNAEDLMDGGRARRDEWLEQQRALQKMKEIEGATFKPHVYTKDAYPHVRARISMQNPAAYLAYVAMKRKQRECLKADLDHEREALQLQHCTFKPQTTPLPAYLIRRLRQQHGEEMQVLGIDPSQSWQYSGLGTEGGSGDECNRNMDESYWEGPGAQEQPNPSRGTYEVAVTMERTAVEVNVASAEDEDVYKSAYERALKYASGYSSIDF